MLKSLRQINNLQFYYGVIRSNGSKIRVLPVPQVCRVQNQPLHGVTIQTNLSLISFLPSREEVRYKSKGKSAKRLQDDSDDEFSDEEEEIKEGMIGEDGSKVRKARIKSLRIDNVLKCGFGLSRRGITESLLANKIKLNGKNVPKKGIEVSVGDELELFESTTDGDVKSQSLGKFSIKKIEPIMDAGAYYIYLSEYKK